MNNNNFPERMCLICREKKEKSELFRLVESKDSFIFDEKQIHQSRGSYVCKSKQCLQKLSKHKKVKISIEELCKMANLLKNDSKDYLNILKAMRNSQALTFGINMVMEDIEKIHFLVIAEDISDKNDNKLISKAKEYNIPYVHFGTKEQLGEIFSKEEITVIAVTNKKIARGLAT